MKRTLFPFLASLLATRLLAADVSPANSAVQTPVADAAGLVAPAETAAAKEARLAWWREARFGMFVHFGLYAIPGRGEWVQWEEQIPNEEYAKLADQFNPTSSVTAWVETAKAAGMKYVVFTSKHHDGFCEFDSQLTDYKITSPQCPAGRDLTKQWADACRATGLKRPASASSSSSALSPRRPMAQPVTPSRHPSIHQPSGTLNDGTPLRAAFMPLVPEASWGRLGVLSQMSTPA